MSLSIPIIRHVLHESAGTVEDAILREGLKFHYVDLFRHNVESPDLNNAPGLVVMGGPMSANDVEKFPYLAKELEWILQAVSAEMPVLGVCLGAQLLAKSLGAKVYPNRVKEIGWYSAELTPEAAHDALFQDCEKQLTVFHWHGDTFDLPSGAVHLAESELCRNQAFRYGKNAYGLQFHIEMTAEMIEWWLNESSNYRELCTVGCIDPKIIREQTPQNLPVLQTLAEKVLGRFVRFCKEKE